jgi:hypothetical protein
MTNVVNVYSDSAGHFTTRANEERTLLSITNADRHGEPTEVSFFELYPVGHRPEIAEIDWSEWMLGDRLGETPDFTLMDEAMIVLLDGVVYGARSLDLAEIDGEPRAALLELAPTGEHGGPLVPADAIVQGDSVVYSGEDGERIEGLATGGVYLAPGFGWTIDVSSAALMLSSAVELVELPASAKAVVR